MHLKLKIYFKNEKGKDLVVFPYCYMESKLPESWHKEIEVLIQQLQDADMQLLYPNHEYYHSAAEIERAFVSAERFAFFVAKHDRAAYISGPLAMGRRHELLEDALVDACAMCNVKMPEPLAQAIVESKKIIVKPPKPMLTMASSNSTQASSRESSTTSGKKTSWFNRIIR